MTTLSDISGLVSKLTTSLQQGGPAANDGDLADQYAEVCASVNERLIQCARMIDEGSSMQALMLAEERPNLLDAVAALSFAKSSDWQEACALNALRQAPKLDRGAVHKLNELYNKGSKADQTRALYKEFRAAMAAKNDAVALDIIKTISNLDPSDADASREVARLERKRKEESLRCLESALEEQDEAKTLSCLEQCEKLEISDAPAIGRGRSVRSSVRAREARLEADELVPQLAQLREDGRWQQCGERANRVLSLAASHGFDLSSDQLALVRTAKDYFESCRQEALRDAQFKEALSAIGEAADQVQSGRQISSKSSLETLEEDRLRLRKTYERAKEFTLPIPESLTARVGQISGHLDAEIERLRKGRRIRNTSLAVAAAVALLSAVAGGYYFLKAHQYASELLTLKSEAKAFPLQKLVAEVRGPSAIYLSVPSLKSAVSEAEAWLQAVDGQKASALAAIERAKETAATGFNGKTPEDAFAVFEQARKALQEMPGDVADTLRPNLSEAEGQLSIWLVKKREERGAYAKDELEKARGQAQQLETASSAEEIRGALKPLTETVRGLLVIRETPVQELRPSEAAQAEIADLEQKVSLNANLLQTYDVATAQLNAAKTIEEFSAAILKLGEVQLPRSQEVKAAQFLATKKISTQDLLGPLVLPNAPEAWAAVKGLQDLSGDSKLPGTTPTEIKSLRDLVNDENLVEIYEAKLQEKSLGTSSWSQRKIYSRGKMRRSNATGDNTTASGIVFDPALSGGRVDFKEQAYAYITMSAVGEESGKRVVDEKESATSQAMNDFQLKDLVTADGSEYRQNILEALDRVMASDVAPPLAKAYVLQELYDIAKARPVWGLAWAPSLSADADAMREVAGGKIQSGDWMLPAKASLSSRLGDWFKNRKDVSYVSQQKLTRALARSALDSGLAVVGYVASDGNFVQTTQENLETVNELWALERGTAKPVVAFRKTAEKESDGFVAAVAAQSLSPVFVISGDPARELSNALGAAGISASDADYYTAMLPPLFTTAPTSSSTEEK